MNAEERLSVALNEVGLDVAPELAAAWVGAIERVVSELGDGIAARAMPRQDGDPAADGPPRRPTPAVRTLDDGPWVWHPDEPLEATGPGTLDGVRLAVKDLIALAGRPLGAGSNVRREAPIEPADAAVVATLRAAGAVVAGSTKLHEFAFGVTGINPYDGTAANPAAPGRVPGGSSSGSAAAVASGDADVALGTDTGGSCRIPAACCSVVGVKPSFGVVDVDGVFPLAPTLDHVGWMAADVHLARRVAEALGVLRRRNGPSDAEADAPDTAGSWVLGVARQAVDAADADVREAFGVAEAALRATGWALQDVSWPGGEETFAVSTAIMFAEAAYVHRVSLAQDPMAYGDDVRARLVQGRALDLFTYLRARERRDRLRARCLQALQRVSAVISPTLAIVPPTLHAALDPAVAAKLVANTRLANVTGLPAISVPVPAVHLPVGIQIEAGDDDTAFIVAASLEAALRRSDR